MKGTKMLRDKITSESGFIMVGLILAAIALLAAGGLGYTAYQARQGQTNLTQGTVNQNDCSKATNGCFGHTLESDANKTYGLVGPVDVSPYVGKNVTVKGKITSTPEGEAIKAVEVKPSPEQAVQNGIMKISVTCTQKIDPQPCASAIRIENENSQGGVGPYQPTDASGNLVVGLVPGRYIITPEPKEGYVLFAPPLPNPITISSGQTTNVQVNYHDGTR
jgi:hypothetical protein